MACRDILIILGSFIFITSERTGVGVMQTASQRQYDLYTQRRDRIYSNVRELEESTYFTMEITILFSFLFSASLKGSNPF